MKSDRRVETYRNYQLVAARGSHGHEGVAWRAGKKVHSCLGSSLDDALARLRAFADADLDAAASGRAKPPEGEEYVRAFREILPRLSDGQLAMLKAHYLAEDHVITATDLAKAAGYSSYSAANLQYGNVGKLLYDILPIELHKRSDGTPVYTSALATPGDRTQEEEYWTWKMRPQVAYAIEREFETGK